MLALELAASADEESLPSPTIDADAASAAGAVCDDEDDDDDDEEEEEEEEDGAPVTAMRSAASTVSCASRPRSSTHCSDSCVPSLKLPGADVGWISSSAV